MTTPRRIAVIDIGKTNAKVALVDLGTRSEVQVLTMPNRVLAGPPWPHFDAEALWDFVCDSLTVLHAAQGIEGISVTTHGACAALLTASGDLAAPVLDYEHAGPEATRTDYDALRPPFSETGSPGLPMGLNLGAQIHWQLATDSALRTRTARIVTWPQYWSFRLTGEAACDVCSLGCHTDLWNPHANDWSSLPAALGIADVLAPPRRPGEVLGKLLPDVRRRIGCGDLPVLCGIHDSNASLLPHLLGRIPPFSVISTGTWIICMSIGGTSVVLDPERDTLINVNAFGHPVPSARFMGGREYDLVRGAQIATPTDADREDVLRRTLMLLPAVVESSGPFPGRQAGWTQADRSPAETEVALGYYLALMASECLRLSGGGGPTLVEGPFASNPWFAEMLASATGRPVIASEARTGTAIGAALLFAPATASAPPAWAETSPDPRLTGYAAAWRSAVQ